MAAIQRIPGFCLLVGISRSEGQGMAGHARALLVDQISAVVREEREQRMWLCTGDMSAENMRGVAQRLAGAALDCAMPALQVVRAAALLRLTPTFLPLL
jgi:hypothetical protein